ncbi:MAG: prepilin-type N-terminal cleavage/methylation domain-containing protein [Smithellaceae bacterium]|nr:prepilin-type N-terminal cleavage/methylation domain-containing protein [Smithellaceae bacterium]
MKTNAKNRQTGFTLIEVIVTLVLVAVMAAMLTSFFGTSLTQSGAPIARLKEASNLQLVMENIVSDYNRLNALNLRYKWQPSNDYRVGSIVTPKTIPATPDGGHYYKCTGAGTSGTTEPNPWPTATGGTVTDGTVTWKESGNIIWQKSHSYLVGDIVVPINNNGHYYQCTIAGMSGANEPAKTAWLPTTSPWTVTDGAVTWTEAGTILASADPNTTKTILKDNLSYYLTSNPARYGNGYSVVTGETKFIKFNTTTNIEEASGNTDEKCNLKVTIKDSNSGRTLTSIFTIR